MGLSVEVDDELKEKEEEGVEGGTLLRNKRLPEGSTTSICVLHFEPACLLTEQTKEPYRVNAASLNW